jgi:hypothetical protein
MLAESPKATLYTGGSDGFVSSTTAPIATGRSNQLPGGIRTHWKSPPLHGARGVEVWRGGLGVACLLPALSAAGA